MTARIEVLEVAAAGQLNEPAGIAALAGAHGVAAGQLDRDGVVRIPVDEELGHAERKALDGGGDVVASGALDGGSAEQAERGVAREAEPGDARGHVLERGGPATTAAPAEPPVLEVPDGEATPREVGNEPILKPKVVPRPPVAAVDQDGDGPRRAPPLGPRELPELIPPLPVGMPHRLDAGEYRGAPTMTPRSRDQVMTTDEWRVEVDLDDEDQHHPLGERLRALDLDDEARSRLGGSVTVTRSGSRLFAYAGSEEAAGEAARVLEELLEAEDLTATVQVTRWHPVEEAWRDAAEPLPQTEAERAAEQARHEAAETREAAEEGRYDYEVHVDPPHHSDAVELERRLVDEGLPVKRRWKHLRVGAPTEERAEEIATRVRAEAPEGTDVAVGATDVQNPTFVFFRDAFDRLRGSD
jgi:hypothetical protein